MDLPTYTNIWRIEKKLYKLYDFRLPAPLPITWIAVFAGVTAPYIFFLVIIGLPFNHTLVWLYVLPPGVLTWFITRPVIESKKLPELVSSQLRYLSEPRTWCRMAPFAEKDEIILTARVWRRYAAGARPRKTRKSAGRARLAERALRPAAPGARSRPSASRPRTAPPARPAAILETAAPASRPENAVLPETTAFPEAAAHPEVSASPPAASSPSSVSGRAARRPGHGTAQPEPGPQPERGAPRPERAAASPGAKRVRSVLKRPRRPVPDKRPSVSREPRPGVTPRPGLAPRPVWAAPPSEREPDRPVAEPSPRPEPAARDHGQPGTPSTAPASWPQATAGTFPVAAPFPEAGPFPAAGPFPEVGAFPEAGPYPEAGPPSGAAALPEATAMSPGPASQDASPAPEASAPFQGSLFAEAAALSQGSLFPEAGPFPEAGAFPDPAAFPDPEPSAGPGRNAEPGQALALEPLPSGDPAAGPQPVPEHEAEREASPQARSGPQAESGAPSPARSIAARVVNLFVDLDAGRRTSPAEDAHPRATPAQDAGRRTASVGDSGRRTTPSGRGTAPVDDAGRRTAPAEDAGRRPPSVERALNGPGRQDDPSWRRKVKVAAGPQGAGKRDRAALDRDRARLPLPGPCRIAVLGCTSGAGQSVIAMMTGRTLAALRETPVAALDLNPGDTSLAASVTPATSVSALLAGTETGSFGRDTRARSARSSARRVDVIAGPSGPGGPRPLTEHDYDRLGRLLAARYPLTMVDPAPVGLTRVLARADQLVLVTPASPEAASALANTQQWLGAHGFDELAAQAVTVVNGVSSDSMADVVAAESVARGRCRAIVRVPWDSQLAPAASPAALQPQTRLACAALAGVLVSGLAGRGTGRTAGPGAPASGAPTHVRGKEAW